MYFATQLMRFLTPSGHRGPISIITLDTNLGLDLHCLGCGDGSLTFLLLGHPRRGLDGRGQTHVVLGVDAEVVLRAGHDVDGGELVVEQALRHRLPGALDGVPLGDHVVQPVVQLLVRGRAPGEEHPALDGLLDGHRPRALGLVWVRRIMREISSAFLIDSFIPGREGRV